MRIQRLKKEKPFSKHVLDLNLVSFSALAFFIYVKKIKITAPIGQWALNRKHVYADSHSLLTQYKRSLTPRWLSVRKNLPK
jgi:hypothetical protein